jgi:hypothetical protein
VVRSGFTDTFDQFLDKLGQRMQQARSAGMDRSAIKRNAERVGDWLDENVSPDTPEQRVLQELWRVSDESEQQAMANAMVRLVERR